MMSCLHPTFCCFLYTLYLVNLALCGFAYALLMKYNITFFPESFCRSKKMK